MYHQLLLNNNFPFLLIKNTLLDMTVNNPIFIFSVITVLWFIPGILVRRFKEKKQLNKWKKMQDDAIKKLYPKSIGFIHRKYLYRITSTSK